MFLDKRLFTQISQVLSRISLPVTVMDDTGRVLLPDDLDRVLPLPQHGLDVPGQPLTMGQYVLVRTDSNPVLVLSVQGQGQAAVDCATLAGALISAISRNMVPHADREDALRSILREEIEGAELESLAQEYHMDLDKTRSVITMHLVNVDAETIQQVLSDAMQWLGNDMMVEMDRHTLVLIKTMDELHSFEDMEQFALAVQNTLMAETNYHVLIGLGDPKKSLSQLGESFRESRRAIDVGRVYAPEDGVYVYRRLLLERFLADVPRDMGLRYNAMMFNRKTARLFNEEMIHTIEKFFENSLNLSETARQLYIHRNTLVYRLDKVQRITGLDLRAFDDAVTFKMMMLLGKSGMEKTRGTGASQSFVHNGNI